MAATLEAMRAMNIYRLMASDGALERSVDPHRSYAFGSEGEGRLPSQTSKTASGA